MSQTDGGWMRRWTALRHAGFHRDDRLLERAGLLGTPPGDNVASSWENTSRQLAFENLRALGLDETETLVALRSDRLDWREVARARITALQASMEAERDLVAGLERLVDQPHPTHDEVNAALVASVRLSHLRRGAGVRARLAGLQELPTVELARRHAATHHDDERIRPALEHELGRRGDEAVQVLLARLGSDTAGVSVAAGWALGAIGGATTIDPLLALVEVDNPAAPGALHALGLLARRGHAERVAEGVVARLGTGDFEVDDDMVSTLIDCGDLAVEPLVAALASPDGRVKLHALEALGKLGRPETIPVLVALHDDPDAVWAFYAICDMLPDPRAIEGVAAFRDHPEERLQPAPDGCTGPSPRRASGPSRQPVR